MRIKRSLILFALLGFLGSRALADVFPDEEGFDRYGGYLSIKGEATGRFHLEQIDGRHFLVTPEGHGFLSIGVTHTGGLVRPEGSGHDYFKDECAGDWKKANQDIVSYFRAWGYNCVGYGGHETTRELLPHFASGHPSGKVSLWMGKAVEFPDVFGDEWKEQARSDIRKTLQKYDLESPKLIGIYWTDMPAWELEQARRTVGKTWVDAIRELPESAPGRIRYERFRRERGEEASDEAFLRLIARQVYSTIGPFTRQLAPDTLIFGERYAGRALPWGVIQEALPYIDVVSVQPNGTTFATVPFERLYQETGKPVMICDHSISFRTPEHPKVMWDTLPDAGSVGRAYEVYLNEGFSTPYLIGYNRCQYINRFKNRQNMLKQGLLKEDGTPYEEFVEWLEKTNWGIHEKFVKSVETRKGNLSD
ncbi:MAG: hypothetical protein AAGB46_13225 [Verrucomicrobiota bacterium]